MRKGSNKVFHLGIISVLTFSLGATPAFALQDLTVSDANLQYSSVTLEPQALVTKISTGLEQKVETLYDLASVASGPDHSFDVDAAIALAETEIGTSRPTGWAMQGECIMSTQRWVNADGGGTWSGSGSVLDNYANATRLPFELVQPGDIIQYENIIAPEAWVTGVHTVMVVAVNENGTLDIIQSNAPAGSGLVSKVTNWLPDPPFGFQAVVWRF